eukprot:TRINITY_DN76218_c0_g1_i1.p1 TRINITY_DN76218_c0_g1~~TRINITY_DN76218_c0_g1_i1.p1  ORF type:complete len:229 (-),score=37.51 TRINITY_DN76218_c0_g1_i1:76-762(-)
MQEPSKSLFIGDLPGTMEEAELKSVFAAYGDVKSCKMLKHSQAGKRGAILEFDSQEEATWIVDNVNGNIPQGLKEPVSVKYKETGKGWGKSAGSPNGDNRWQPYGKEGDKGGGKGNCGISTLVKGLFDAKCLPGGGEWPSDDASIFVSGLPRDTTDFDLYKIFSPFGGIAPHGASAQKSDDKTCCRGVAFVNFIEPASAQNAVQTLNGTTLPDGTYLKVAPKTLKPKN